MATSVDRLAAQLKRLEKEVAARASYPQLKYSSIDGGTVPVMDEVGDLRMLIGRQHDGTVTTAVVASDAPPTPAPVGAFPTPGGARLYWDGTFEDGALAPMDFQRVTFHVVPSTMDLAADFNPADPNYIVGEANSATGSQVTTSLDEGDHLATSVAWSEAGKPSAYSAPQPVSPDPVAGTVTAPPSESPTITVTGTTDSLIVETAKVPAGTRLQYHISEDENFDPLVTGAATMYGVETSATIGVITSLADGTRLEMDKSYAIRVLAVNDLGVAPAASGPVLGQLNDQIVSDLIAAKLVVGFILTGHIMVGQIEISADGGITIPQAGSERSTVLKADGTGSTFVGDATFDALTTLGNLTIEGSTNFINGLMTLRSGVGDPLQRATVTTGHVGFFLEMNTAQRGLGQFSDGSWATTDYYNPGSGGGYSYVDIWDAAGLSMEFINLPTNWLTVGGCTVINDKVYVLCSAGTSTGGFSQTNYRVYVYTRDGAGNWLAPTSFDPAINTSGTWSRPMIGQGNQPGHVGIAYVQNGDLFYRQFDANHAVSFNRTLSTSWGAGDVCGVGHQFVPSADGTTENMRIVVANGTKMHAWRVTADALAPRVYEDDWAVARGTNIGLCYGVDGFWHSANTVTLESTAIYHYTKNSGEHDFSYTWADTDPLGDGVAETLPAPVRTLAPQRMADWLVTLPSLPPDDGTVDGANAAAAYVALPGGALIKQGYYAEGATRYRLKSVSATGDAPPAVNGFLLRPGSAIGQFQSDKKDPNGDPIIDLRGDARGRVGGYRWDTDGRNLDPFQESTGQGGTYSTTAPVSNATPAGIADLVWTAPTSGRVMITMSMYMLNKTTSGSCLMWPRTREGGVLRAGTIVRDDIGLDGTANYGTSYVKAPAISVIDGLTPGATYNTHPVMTASGGSGASWTLGVVSVIPLP